MPREPAMTNATTISNGRLAGLVVVAFAVFLGLAFALVPLYQTFCQVTGLNGATRDATAAPGRIDTARWVQVEFTSTVMPGLPWRFSPEIRHFRVHPGEVQTVYYDATNLTDRPGPGRAVMSVTPENAATHFRKITCFCYRQQMLGPHQTRRMALMFFVAPDVPQDMGTITLSYAVYGITPTQG